MKQIKRIRISRRKLLVASLAIVLIGIGGVILVSKKSTNTNSAVHGVSASSLELPTLPKSVVNNPKITGTIALTDNPGAIRSLAARTGLGIKREQTLRGGKSILVLDKDINSESIKNLKKELPDAKISPNYQYKSLFTFTNQDTYYPDQWNLPKIQMPRAWDITTGSTEAIIAVIDTGILSQQTINGTTFSQPDFPDARIWKNGNEVGVTALEGPVPNCTSRGLALNKNCNNRDDDSNGKIDDWRGWDFMGGYVGSSAACPNYSTGSTASTLVREDNDPQPYSCDSPYHPSELNKTHHNGTCDFGESACFVGHGTMVASIAGAASNNGALIAGMDHQAMLMNIRVLDGYGYTTTDRVAAAVDYAAANGADAINLSLAVNDCSGAFSDPVLEDVMSRAKSSGSVIVAASGNESHGIVCYPASSNHAMAIGASDKNDNRASFSSYGPQLDVLAPGASIPLANAPSSRINSDYYPTASGTSMATPHVAGLVGLIRAVRPNSTFDDVYALIVMSVDLTPGMKGKTLTNEYGYGRINVRNALLMANGSMPVYRLHHTGNGDHFYTTNFHERNLANMLGYVYEGHAFWSPGSGGILVHRLYLQRTGDHFYTTDLNERDRAVSAGYKYEGIGFRSNETGLPIYRLYNPSSGDHFFTSNSGEKDSASTTAGYVYEGIGFHAPNY